MGDRQWRIGDRVLALSHRGLIMGVLNVTPDSFSDGGQYLDANAALVHARQMISEGADIIDVGGESTRPGSDPVAAEEEWRRVGPVIEGMRKESDVLISIDTSKAAVAEAALKAGANLVNDVTGGTGDAEMMPLLARRRAAFVIMHMQGNPKTMQNAPHYDDVVESVGLFFRQRYEVAVGCGIDPMAIAFDPGIGFGKTLEHNLELLGNLERLRLSGRPLVVGVSRKSFLGRMIGSDRVEDRVMPTVALTALLRGRGGDVFRVHDVKENARALRVAEAVLER